MAVLADTVDIVIGIDPHKHTHTAAIIAATTAGNVTQFNTWNGHAGWILCKIVIYLALA